MCNIQHLSLRSVSNKQMVNIHIYGLDLMITKIYVYVWPWIQLFFVTGACLIGGHHYDFASSMGHPRSNSIGLLL
jgi:hypothetical protein